MVGRLSGSAILGKLRGARMDLLQETLDALDEGLVRFDGELRLLAWNRRLVEMLDYPPALMRPGMPFLEFVAFNIRRGEHGPGSPRLIIRQRLACLHHSYERRRPDGTLLRIRGKAMPDGGFLKLFTAAREARPAADADPAALSAREQEVLAWAVCGKTSWETATILRLSAKTVEFHLANCRRKLGAATKAQLVATAIRHGLVAL